MSEHDFDQNVGAAILGFYAGLKICRKVGIDPQDLLELVRRTCIDRAVGISFDEALGEYLSGKRVSYKACREISFVDDAVASLLRQRAVRKWRTASNGPSHRKSSL